MNQEIKNIIDQLEELEPDRRGEMLDKLEKIFSRIEYCAIVRGVMAPGFGLGVK